MCHSPNVDALRATAHDIGEPFESLFCFAHATTTVFHEDTKTRRYTKLSSYNENVVLFVLFVSS